MLCQFRASPGRLTLKDFIDEPDVYPAGRLDADSEGLVLLTDSGPLQARISAPEHKLDKSYLVQVEGTPDASAIRALVGGVDIHGERTLPADVRAVHEPDWLWPRDPPVRFRKSVPTAWLEIVLRQGRNRQVRRMTAAVGHPTLRLVRVSIGPYALEGLAPGEHARRAPSLLMDLGGGKGGGRG